MRIAVTGGSGFIGSHVVDVLAEHGHDVVVGDFAVRTLTPAASYVEADIGDVDALAAAFADCEVVFHLAGVSNVDHAQRNPVGTFQVNVTGTAAVCEGARQVGARRVVLASTVWVHPALTASPDGSVTEDSPVALPELAHVYTASK